MPRGTVGYREIVFASSVSIGSWRSRHILGRSFAIMIPEQIVFSKKTWAIDSAPRTGLLKDVTFALHRQFSRTDPDLNSQNLEGVVWCIAATVKLSKAPSGSLTNSSKSPMISCFQRSSVCFQFVFWCLPIELKPICQHLLMAIKLGADQLLEPLLQAAIRGAVHLYMYIQHFCWSSLKKFVRNQVDILLNCFWMLLLFDWICKVQ